MKNSMVFLSVAAVLILAQGQGNDATPKSVGPLFQVGKIYVTGSEGPRKNLDVTYWPTECYFEVVERDGTWARIKMPKKFRIGELPCGYKNLFFGAETYRDVSNAGGVWINTAHLRNVIGPVDR
ncbi:hypothetical protein LCGC14_2371270 [marine sediment metagenome]|uniref:Uncharacterized protein n=1 Tax=marine sediment metagenome TaxID=412755 RepID=A0A0F9C3P8_9ZZZZ